MLADVATAKDFAKDQRGKLLGAYVGDTWGRLWRYTPTGANLVTNLGCQAPLHFAPTVVQLDRDDPSNYSHELYLVQVTNSPLDEVTENFAPSKMIIMREKPDGGGILGVDALFGTAGKIVLTAGQADGLCGMTNPGGGCATPLPASARPMGTPTAILKRDGSGFQIISLWYVPDANGCSKGTTYLALHEVVNGAATQKQGLKIANEPVTSPVVAAGRIFVISSQGAMSIDGDLAATFVPGTAQSPRSGVGVGRFNILGWTEL